MSKFFILVFILSIVSFSNVLGQCIPVPFGGSELTNPSSADGIDPAAETQPYDQVIIMRIPYDTIYNGLVVTIDSVGVTSITGLPSSLSWITNRDNDYWPGDTFGCILFEGTPVVGDAGTYTIIINATVNALGSVMPYNMTYEFKIFDDTHVGYSITKLEGFQVLQNSPNPFEQTTNIDYFTLKAEHISFIIYDILGNIVYKKSNFSKKGKNTIVFNKSDLANGVYIYELRNGTEVISKRMVIK